MRWDRGPKDVRGRGQEAFTNMNDLITACPETAMLLTACCPPAAEPLCCHGDNGSSLATPHPPHPLRFITYPDYWPGMLTRGGQGGQGGEGLECGMPPVLHTSCLGASWNHRGPTGAPVLLPGTLLPSEKPGQPRQPLSPLQKAQSPPPLPTLRPCRPSQKGIRWGPSRGALPAGSPP